MSNMAIYFAANRYQAKWAIGDRVIGKWNKIPFVGSVGNDRQLNDRDGPEITVHLDLPIKYQGIIRNIIVVKHRDIKEYK
jgi:hypothetical protein